MKSLLIAGVLAVCSATFYPVSAIADSKDTLVEKDVKFVKTAASDGMGELKVAELGVKKAENADVKAFAEMLVKDHTANNMELKALAEKKGVDVSSIVEEKIVNKVKDLEKQSGPGFDEAFLKFMEKDHKDCIDKFEDGQKNVRDGDVKAYIDKTLPVLRAHHDKVKALMKK